MTGRKNLLALSMEFLRAQAAEAGQTPTLYAQTMLRARLKTDELSRMLEISGGDPVEALAVILLNDIASGRSDA